MSRPLVQIAEEEYSHSMAPDEPGFGSLATSRGGLPLKAMDVHGRIDGLLAQVTLRQTFVNTLDEPLEATYIFPLPDRAAVTGFRMEVAGRVIEGVLEERGKARREYDQAIAGGPPGRHRRGGAARRLHPARRQPDARRGGDRRAHAGRRPALPGRRGDVPLPAGRRPALHPGRAAARAIGRRRHRRRHRRRARRLADHAAGAAARLPQPGAAVAVDRAHDHMAAAAERFRSSLHAVLTDEEQDGYRRMPAAAGRAARPRLHPALPPRGERRVTATSLSTLRLHPDARGCEGTFALTLVPPAGAASDRRGRATWCSCSIARAAWTAGRWSRPAGAGAHDRHAQRARPLRCPRLRRLGRDPAGLPDGAARRPPTATASGPSSTWPDRGPRRHRDGRAARPGRRACSRQRPAGNAADDRDASSCWSPTARSATRTRSSRRSARGSAGIRVFTLGIDQAVNEAFLRRLAELGGGSVRAGRVGGPARRGDGSDPPPDRHAAADGPCRSSRRDSRSSRTL